MGIAKHTALNGGLAEIRGPLDVDGPAACQAWVQLSWGIWEIAAGRVSLGRAIAAEFGIIDFEQQYAFQGGDLSVGHAPQVDPSTGREELFRLGVWEGQDFCAVAHVYDGSHLDLVALFAQFEIRELMTGLVLRPIDDATTGYYRDLRGVPHISKQIPGIGTLRVAPRTPWTERELPSYTGAPVDGGELFAVEDEYFVLVGESTISRLTADWDLVDQPAAVEAASSLVASWSEGE